MNTHSRLPGTARFAIAHISREGLHYDPDLRAWIEGDGYPVFGDDERADIELPFTGVWEPIQARGPCASSAPASNAELEAVVEHSSVRLR